MSAPLLGQDSDDTSAAPSVLQRFNEKMFTAAARGPGQRLQYWCTWDRDGEPEVGHSRDSDDSDSESSEDSEVEKKLASKLVARASMALLIIEDLFIGLFWYLGTINLLIWVNIAQFVFLVLALSVDVVAYSCFRSNMGLNNKVVNTLMGIPVTCLKVPVELFWLLSLAPNYVHVINMAGISGASYNIWNNPQHAAELHHDFHRNWNNTIIIGEFVSDTGIPNLMTAMLVMSVFIHLLTASFWLMAGESVCGPDRDTVIAGEIADAANLQFLGKCIKSLGRPDEGDHVCISRLLFAGTIKYALIWVKNSFTAVMWPYMGNDEKFTMLLALLLAWYGILQLFPQFVKTVLVFAKVKSSVPAVYIALQVSVITGFVFLCLGLLQQGLHTGGIFICESHDFSVIHGCTAVDSA